MSPRPKSAPDSQILDAAARLLARLGPARLRLEDVAREVGLAPATLLLRFKSKRNLLLAVAEHSVADMATHFRERRRASPSALQVVTEVCERVREIAADEQQLAHLLAFLQLSLEDPEFRACAERHDASLQHEMRLLLDEARASGELAPVCTTQLARAIIAMVRGSLLTWSSLGRDTAPEHWIRNDLDTLLGPYRLDTSQTKAPSTRRIPTASARSSKAAITARRRSARALS